MDNNYIAYIYPVISPDDGVHLADAWFATDLPEEIVDDYFDGEETSWVDDSPGFPPLRLVA